MMILVQHWDRLRRSSSRVVCIDRKCIPVSSAVLQVDTKDILFICGGAFVELEKTIAERCVLFSNLYKKKNTLVSGLYHGDERLQ